MELTYNELEHSTENLWSLLFTTGYLTQRKILDDDRYELMIPNREIRSLFITQIQTWFKDSARKDSLRLRALCNALVSKQSNRVETLLNHYLWNGISIRDTATQNTYKENFYHGMLLGLLQYEENWLIRSNEESGVGYSDILIETQNGIGVVIEIKYAQDGNLDKACQNALQQIEERHYTAKLSQDGMDNIIKYGIAFYQKKCKVVQA